jgi:hypothetical protein
VGGGVDCGMMDISGRAMDTAGRTTDLGVERKEAAL